MHSHCKRKKNCIPNEIDKKDLHSQCKKWNKFAFPMQKIKKICIPNAKNKRNLHSQCQKFLKNAFPVPKIKKDLHSQCQKWKKVYCQCKKMQNICTVRPRGTRLMCPKKNRVSRNRLSWGLLLFSKVSKFKKNSVPWG